MYELDFVPFQIETDRDLRLPDGSSISLISLLLDIKETFRHYSTSIPSTLLANPWAVDILISASEVESYINVLSKYIRTVEVPEALYNKLEEELIPRLEFFVEHYLELLVEMGELRWASSNILPPEGLAIDPTWGSWILPVDNIEASIEYFNSKGLDLPYTTVISYRTDAALLKIFIPINENPLLVRIIINYLSEKGGRLI